MVSTKGGPLWDGMHDGCPDPLCWSVPSEHVASIVDLACQAIRDRRGEQGTVDLADLIRELHGDGRFDVVEGPGRVEGHAPVDCNLYCDGSVSHPEKPWLSVGGLGLWTKDTDHASVSPARGF
eukprot:15466457-Alexandrium_andersonii.AAC.1